VFENRVLRRIFGPTKDEVTWEWRGLYNEGLIDEHPSPSIFYVIKSRRTERVELLEICGRGELPTGFRWET
jgi:hypothetical protein